MDELILMRCRITDTVFIDNVTVIRKDQFDWIMHVIDNEVEVEIGPYITTLKKEDFTFNPFQEDVEAFQRIFNDRVIGYNIFPAIAKAYLEDTQDA